MNSIPEKSIQETQQDANNNSITDNHADISNNQETQVENFFSNSEEEIIQNSYKYEKILSHKVDDDGKISYLVKYPNLSYHHVEWISENIVQQQDGGEELISKYIISHPKDSDPPKIPFDPQYLNIDKLITFRQESNGSKSYLTKWCNLDYQNLTWEVESTIPQNLINDFIKSNQIPDFKEHFIKRKNDYSIWEPLDVPDFSPKNYQIEGLKYITHSFCNEQNVILSDEKGLGSSIQCAMFLKWLVSNESNRGPFLIIATEKRLEEWKESLNKLQFGPVLTFLKPKIQRDTIAEYELFYPGTKLAKMNLILSSFSIQVCNKILSEVNWQSIFVDLNHFADEDEKKKCLTQDFFDLLSNFESSFTVLIARFQVDDLNILKNYFSILFKNLAKVVLSFIQQLNEQNQIIILKSALQSILLERTFSEINIVHHPITEYIIDCGLTEIQLDYSQSVYQKFISYMVNRSNGCLIKSIFNDLNLICNHPYLHKGAQQNVLLCKKFSDLSKEADSLTDFSQKALIESSSKMKFLDKLVNHIKLHKKKNGRLIVFSHNEEVLNIIQEYFENRRIFFDRIGSSIRGEQRNKAIMKFNMIGSIDFAFLVCLKGGIDGIKLNNASDAVLFDTDWNPIKDIEVILNIIDSDELNIYRLLPSRSIERLTYDRSILKSTYSETDKLTFNGEISTLLGFGIDLHDTIEYANDSVNEIIDRSTRNYYQNSNDPILLNSKNSQFTPKDKKYKGPWPNFVPYVIKEDFPNDKTSILHNSQPSSIFWTTERLVTLREGLTRFGWGRWSTMMTKYKEVLYGASDFEMEAICHIFLRILLINTDNNFSIVESIYSQPLSVQASIYEEKFRKENSDLQISLFTTNCNEKLASIEFMYLINVIVATCSKPPEEIVVPYLESPLNESWNQDADRYLIFHVYNNGYMHFGNSPIDPTTLEFRLKLIIETLKERFLIFHEMKNNSSQFEHFSLLRAVNMLTCEEQQRYIQFLVYYGWTTPDDFKVRTGSYRTPKELLVIHEVIIGFCRGKKEMINDLAESIPQSVAQLILAREKLLYKVRNELKKEDVKKPDLPIIEYVTENGFIDLLGCEEIRQRFGTNNSSIEYEVTNILLKYLHNFQLFGTSNIPFTQKSQIVIYNESNEQEKSNQSALSSTPSSQHLKNKVNSQVSIEYDKDGNPVMPIQIYPSLIIVNLGEIVTEKPNFYNNRYIYPKNFASLKLYKSTINPNDKVWYKSTIIDDGTDSPLFRVEMKDDPSIFFEGRAPTKPWLEILKVINDKKGMVGQQKFKKVTVSGPEYFGLASPIVQSLIQKMKGADICINYGKVEDVNKEFSYISPSSSAVSTQDIYKVDETTTKTEIDAENNDNENKEKENNVNEDVDDKIVPRKRNKVINYADSTSSSFSESDDEETNQKDKEFNAVEENDDDDDENEPFIKEDDDFEVNDEDDEDEFFEQKKRSSRSSRTHSNAHSVATHSQNIPTNNNNSKPNDNDGDNCAIQ